MRYDRQTMLPEIGAQGQRRLASARVLVVGAGGLGSPAALYLAGAGVGTIGIADGDTVSLTNLQRQVLYSEREVGMPKAECARQRLLSLNGGLSIIAHNEFICETNARRIIGGYDYVLDGCDNFPTRYLINDVCIELGKIYVYGAISAFDGQVSVFNYRGHHSYRDIFPDEEELIAMPAPDKGVLGVTPGIVGCAEAAEVIKMICGFGDVLSGKMWHIDVKSMQTHTFFL